MSGMSFPPGWTLEPVRQTHPRRLFDCGEKAVNDWLRTKALQHQSKRLSATKVLVDADGGADLARCPLLWPPQTPLPPSSTGNLHSR
jgi:hypothetical protein